MYILMKNMEEEFFTVYSYTLLERFWRISLYFTEDAIAKLHVTESFMK